MKYQSAVIFTKKANLLPWLYAKADKACAPVSDRAKAMYGQEREIQLMALFRTETDGQYRTKTLCLIKCPINPLPVKGEFEVPSFSILCNFLNANGWKKKQVVYGKHFD